MKPSYVPLVITNQFVPICKRKKYSNSEERHANPS